MLLLNALCLAFSRDSTKKRSSARISSDDANQHHGGDHYDVICDGVVKDSSSGTPGRSLPPLPATNSNHDGYTRLNSVPENTGKVDDATDYDNLVGTVPPHNGPANPVGYRNEYYVPSTLNVNKVDDVGKDNRVNEDVIITEPKMENSEGGDINAGDNPNSYFVPSAEDISKVEEMANDNGTKEEGYQSDGGHENGVDTNGYLVLHHVPSPKNVRKVDDDRRAETSLNGTTSCRADAGSEDTSGLLKPQHSSSAENSGTIDKMDYSN